MFLMLQRLEFFMYSILCTRKDIYYAMSIVRQYQSNPRPNYWVEVKHILSYLRRTRNYILVYWSKDLTPLGFTNFDFQLDRDSRKSTSRLVFTLERGTIV